MARKLMFVSLALIVVAAAGCGGGKGVSTTTTTTPPPAATSRLVQPGDDLRYEVTGTHFDGWCSWPVTGTYAETVLTDGSAPANYIAIKQQLNLSTHKTEVSFDTEKLMWIAQSTNDVFKSLEERIDVSGRYYVTQDADSTIWTCGGMTPDGMVGRFKVTATEYAINSPVGGRYRILGTPLAVGTQWHDDVQQSAGDNGTFGSAFVVSTYEQVTVPAGTYRAHRVTGYGKAAGMLGDVDMWWCPDIGAPVQFSVTSTTYIRRNYDDPDADGLASPGAGGTGYAARTLTLTFKLVSKSRSGGA